MKTSKRIVHILFMIIVLLMNTSCMTTYVQESGSLGVITQLSDFTVRETVDRLTKKLKNKDVTIFNVIEHSQGAKGVGIDLRETVLVIFGNPKLGSPLMKCQQIMALDFPQKILVWQDADAKVWLSYNQPNYLKKRHHVQGCEAELAKLTQILDNISRSFLALK